MCYDMALIEHKHFNKNSINWIPYSIPEYNSYCHDRLVCQFMVGFQNQI